MAWDWESVIEWGVWLLLPLVGAALLAAAYRAARAVQPVGRAPFTWRYSFQRLGWAPWAVLAVIIGLLNLIARTLDDPLLAPTRQIEALVPLVAAGHAAFAFSPEDEPALELTLMLPRPLTWLMAERLALLLVGYGALALVGSLLTISLTHEPLGQAVVRWLAPLLMLSAVGVIVTLIGRQAAFGVAVVGLVWFGLIYAGDGLLVLWPQAWPLHLYLQPGAAHYGLNRAGLAVGGAGLLLLAATTLVRDPERVLLGGRTLPYRAEDNEAASDPTRRAAAL